MIEFVRCPLSLGCQIMVHGEYVLPGSGHFGLFMENICLGFLSPLFFSNILLV